ncbi:MAG TPA: peptidoglycan DD-metalloendopeptidase family protein [Paludibacter sp.]|nr:peptidoglycan DD-metalloendopeptidase family protein [Paludibacter sp.]
MQFQSSNRIFILIFSALALVFSLQAQSVKELELQRKQTLKNLETTNKLLKETKKSQRSSLTKLTIIGKNINERKVLIKNISTEIGKLDDEMGQLDQEKTRLEKRLSILKADYARLVQEAHINRSVYAKIMFVLSAKSFDQSYRRLRYLQEYSDYRKQQVREIEGVKVQIQQKNDSLQVHKTTKVEVVKQKETEAQNLTKDQQKEKVLLTDLQKKEKKLRADQKIQQKKANDLNNKIASIIAAEIRKAEAKRAAEKQKQLASQKAAEAKRIADAKLAAEAKKAAEQAKRLEVERAAEKRKIAEAKDAKAKSEASRAEVVAAKKAEEEAKAAVKVAASETAKAKAEVKATSNGSVSALTKEETLLSGNFERNQGRLPWPTSNGFISGHYGVQPHAVLKHVTTNNKGIYIQTPSGSSARAVFEGVVTQRFSIPGNNNAVIIQHGNYRTVYANLTQIFVREGDHVSAKQAIGKIYTDDDSDNKTELYFQIWNGKSLQNPESWIAR